MTNNTPADMTNHPPGDIFQDYPQMSSIVNDQTNLNNDFDDEIGDVDVTNDGSLQSQIDAINTTLGNLQNAAPSNHYHSVPEHTHYNYGVNHQHTLASGGTTGYYTNVNDNDTGSSGILTTSAPGGTTSVGHSHPVEDIPHVHNAGVIADSSAHGHHTSLNTGEPLNLDAPQ